MRDERARNTSAAAPADIQERHRAGRRADACMRSQWAKRSRETCTTTRARSQTGANRCATHHRKVCNTRREGSQTTTERFATHDRKVRETCDGGPSLLAAVHARSKAQNKSGRFATHCRKVRKTPLECSQRTTGGIAKYNREVRNTQPEGSEHASRMCGNRYTHALRAVPVLSARETLWAPMASTEQGGARRRRPSLKPRPGERTTPQHAAYVRRRGSTQHHRFGLCRCVRAHRFAYCALAHGCVQALACRVANASSLPAQRR